MDNQLEEATTSALLATRSFVHILRNEGLKGWADRFEKIAVNIGDGQLVEATYLFSLTQYSGPGSLSDVYAKDEATYNAAWGACAKALRALKRTLPDVN